MRGEKAEESGLLHQFNCARGTAEGNDDFGSGFADEGGGGAVDDATVGERIEVDAAEVGH